MNWRAWVLALLLLPLRAAGQPQPLADFAHSAWTVNDGAPADIWTMARAPAGYLWLGTGLGLFRFDGVRFDRYPLRDGQRLKSTNINALHVLPSGDIWLGLFAGGTVRLRDGVATAFGEAEGMPPGRVLRIAADQDGHLWAAAGGGLARFDGSRWRRVGPEMGYPELGAQYVLVDCRGVLWVVSQNRLFWLARGGQRFQDTGEVLSGGAVLAEDRAGRIWVSDGLSGTRPLPDYAGGAAPASGRGQPQIAHGWTAHFARAKQMLFAEDGSLWLTEAGVGVRRLRDPAAIPVGRGIQPSDELETFTRRQGLPADIVVPLVQGTEGEIWVGSNHGLSNFRSQRLRVVPEFGTGEPAGFGVALQGDGVLVASGRRALRLLPPGASQPVELGRSVKAIVRDRQGQLWLSDDDGVAREVDGQFERVHLTQPPRDYHVQALAPDHCGGAWIAVPGLGMFHAGPDGARRDRRFEPGGAMPTAIIVAPDGDTWFGYDDEVLRLRGDTVARFGAADGLLVGRTTNLFVSADGSVYVAGEAGFARFDGRRFAVVTAERDDAFAHVSGVAEAGNGDLWLNGGRGVVQLRAADLPAMFGPARRLNYRLLNWRDGLPGIAQQATAVSTAVRDHQDRIWFATNRAVAWVDAARAARNENPGRVEIQALRAGDRNHHPTPGLELPAGTRSVAIRYSALTLAGAERARFRYRLDGVDADWQEADMRREATYANLGHGDYRFRVLAASGDGVWGTEEATLAFHIEPTFWQTRGFMAGAVLLVAALVAGAYVLRTRAIAAGVRRQLEARHRERERIARDLHDTLLQSTQALIINVQGAASRLPADAPVRGQIEAVLDRADAVVLEARERVRDLRSGDVDGAELLQVLQQLGRELAHESGRPELVFRAVGSGTPRPLERSVFDQLHLIACEALRNAFHHAQARQIEVEVCWGQAELMLHVRDDGVGIPPAWVRDGGRPGHWGLQGMRERALEVGGRVNLVSESPGGTEVEIRVPGRFAYRALRPAAPS
ncbi:triple tyrosine motif-containing protein [Roseateles asaccharophilus]|uniref:Signal transduction histidine kinase/ligand-binding sensor domain-containing protein n=1 Tax=Roseateles asaccharophilus TaxID=582607 RepID=A0ABU2A781_9BURK|nr:triple tyrosine motif-containing protein [Roseateles asaccharophilus]MDR7333053.1 signal transduction histidine kinase/ligand-binding sensor domain-containing protein [Roseateles asaccharophilus]